MGHTKKIFLYYYIIICMHKKTVRHECRTAAYYFTNTDGSKPALSRAFFAASLMASDVMVAPEMASTLRLFAERIFSGSSSRALVPIPTVSLSPVATSLMILSAMKMQRNS
jgi:hypothetical protein